MIRLIYASIVMTVVLIMLSQLSKNIFSIMQILIAVFLQPIFGIIEEEKCPCMFCGIIRLVYSFALILLFINSLQVVRIIPSSRNAFLKAGFIIAKRSPLLVGPESEI